MCYFRIRPNQFVLSFPSLFLTMPLPSSSFLPCPFNIQARPYHVPLPLKLVLTLSFFQGSSFPPSQAPPHVRLPLSSSLLCPSTIQARPYHVLLPLNLVLTMSFQHSSLSLPCPSVTKACPYHVLLPFKVVLTMSFCP